MSAYEDWFLVVEFHVAQLVEHAVSMIGGFEDALEVDHAEASVIDFLAASFLFEDVSECPVVERLGSPDAVEVYFNDIGSRWQHVMHSIAAVGTGAPFGHL